jgi:hypothetical protein
MRYHIEFFMIWERIYEEKRDVEFHQDEARYVLFKKWNLMKVALSSINFISSHKQSIKQHNLVLWNCKIKSCILSIVLFTVSKYF